MVNTHEGWINENDETPGLWSIFRAIFIESLFLPGFGREERKNITNLQGRLTDSPLGYLLGLTAFPCVISKALISSWFFVALGPLDISNCFHQCINYDSGTGKQLETRVFLLVRMNFEFWTGWPYFHCYFRQVFGEPVFRLISDWVTVQFCGGYCIL